MKDTSQQISRWYQTALSCEPRGSMFLHSVWQIYRWPRSGGSRGFSSCPTIASQAQNIWSTDFSQNISTEKYLSTYKIKSRLVVSNSSSLDCTLSPYVCLSVSPHVDRVYRLISVSIYPYVYLSLCLFSHRSVDLGDCWYSMGGIWHSSH
mgnify:CR=1 FL=1